MTAAGPSPCGTRPSAAAEGALRIAGPASAEAGLGVLGYCFASVAWQGHVEFATQPELGADWQLRLRVVDTQLYDANRQKSGVASRVWDAVKGWAEQALPTFAFDVGPPVQEMKTALAHFAGPPGSPSATLAAAVQSLRPVGLATDADGLKVWLALTLPDAVAAAPAPAPALTPAEIKRWQATLDHWDGFLTFVVKDLGGAGADYEARTELLDLLLSARHDLLAVLGPGARAGRRPRAPALRQRLEPPAARSSGGWRQRGRRDPDAPLPDVRRGRATPSRP